MSKIREYWKPFFDLLKSPTRMKIMIMLHAAHIHLANEEKDIE